MESSESDKQLGIYLNDHLAGSTGGLALAQRARSNSTDPERTGMWNSICGEVEDDRQVLVSIIRELGVPRNYAKFALSWTAEKAGRLKLNGRISGPTDLGQFLELEMMYLGVTGKRQLWRTLATLGDSRLGHFDFAVLEQRADSQRERLERYRLALGTGTFG